MYHAVRSVCAAELTMLRLPLMTEKAMEILRGLGFYASKRDIIALGRSCVGRSEVRRGARPSEAPKVVDCSSFVQWLYAEMGIEIPRRSIQQREYGRQVFSHEIMKGDLLFATGSGRNYYWDDPLDAVGHVAIATGEGTVLHTVRRPDGRGSVKESPIECITREGRFRGARRLVEDWDTLMTFIVPPSFDVLTSDDLRWIILQNLP